MQWNEFRSHIGHLSTREHQRMREAFDLGKKAHAGQVRKSGDPYFSHPISVAIMLAGMGADSDTIVAALLHDTVEDTSLTLSEIEKCFGQPTANLIEGVTKLSIADVAGQPNLDEQIETLRKIFTLMEKDVRIMVIKLVDRLHNMQTAEFLPVERQRLLAQETLDVYVKIADRLCMQDLRDDLEGLALNILDPELFDKLSTLRGNNETHGEDSIRIMRKKIKSSHPGHGVASELLYEHKTWTAIREQLQTEGTIVTGISTITVVFRCPDIQSCYAIFGLLHQLWKREVMSFQDFINSPAVNGYRGLHTTVILEDGTRVRCKIRTEEMHDYARNGIALRCFEPEHAALLEHLPWAERITPLSQNTEGQSGEFWLSLQSDILGESIVIHGPADQSVVVPKGSTALDGAFYLFREEALKLTSISISGKSVSLSTPLQHAASLNVTIGKHPTAEREWLQWVQTGFAVAMIRTALASGKSDREKIAVGKELLQLVLSERRKGFLEEFSEQGLQTGIHALGYATLDDVYKAIADGRISPAAAYRSLFEKTEASEADKRAATIRYTADMDDIETMDRLNIIHRSYSPSLLNIRYKRGKEGQRSIVTLKAHLTEDEESKMIASLEHAGAMHIRRSSYYKRIAGLATIAVLIVLWGLDPVMASALIHEWNVRPVDLLIVRFWSLAIISGILLAWMNIRNPLSEVRLPLRNFSLWVSVGLLFCVALTTYIALETTSPSHYTIPMTTAGMLLTSIVNRRRWKVLVAMWLLLLGGLAALVLYTPAWPARGIIFTTLAVVCFSFFSIVSERYKRQERVDSRAVQYFFVLSLSCAVLTLPFLSIASLYTLSYPVIAGMVLFSVFFAGLPYYMYYYLLSHREIDFILRYSFLIIFSTVIGQALILNAMNWKAVLPASILVIAGATLPLLKTKQR